ncbi:MULTISPECIES: hypothetical protein [Acetobacteraceae]|uniref:Uncharacterized protein n=9 Tax=Acetobacteraceae TaxID=433 RepID=A0A850NGB9_9PROT|nr:MULTISPECIES: hypothetical protein [Acetobacteraceae]MBB3173687.1 hypothetical protein [Endobacter medicaginis]NHN83171.1 hypothetical protein [Acetobacter musti]NHN89890.1 hypothetical protein [Acetobacter conturbans]NHO32078.1 hypothetical protein [Acetobacter fallax]ETC97448.1 hypothetical protein P792_15755 [Asaia sp. SF2.1]
MTKPNEPAPLACTLENSDLARRLEWIASLNARALRSAHRDGLHLVLDYDPAARDDIARMVEGERTCCAFLAFDIAERMDALTLTITAPEYAREAAETLLEQFASRSQPATAPMKKTCGCAAECGA